MRLWVAQGYMLRVVSSLLTRERWLQLPASHSNHRSLNMSEVIKMSWTMGLPGLKPICLSVPCHICMVCFISQPCNWNRKSWNRVQGNQFHAHHIFMLFMLITFSCSAPANRCPSCASIAQLRLVQISGISSNKFVSFWGLFFFPKQKEFLSFDQHSLDIIVL